MKKGVQTIALFLLLSVIALLAIFSLTAGLPAAQDDEPTSTPVGAGGQDPLAGETDEPEFGGDDPLESGPNREPDIDSPGDSGLLRHDRRSGRRPSHDHPRCHGRGTGRRGVRDMTIAKDRTTPSPEGVGTIIPLDSIKRTPFMLDGEAPPTTDIREVLFELEAAGELIVQRVPEPYVEVTTKYGRTKKIPESITCRCST